MRVNKAEWEKQASADGEPSAFPPSTEPAPGFSLRVPPFCFELHFFLDAGQISQIQPKLLFVWLILNRCNKQERVRSCAVSAFRTGLTSPQRCVCAGLKGALQAGSSSLGGAVSGQAVSIG